MSEPTESLGFKIARQYALGLTLTERALLVGVIDRALDARSESLEARVKALETLTEDTDIRICDARDQARAAIAKRGVAEEALEGILKYCEKGERCLGDAQTPCRIHEHKLASEALAKIRQITGAKDEKA